MIYHFVSTIETKETGKFWKKSFRADCCSDEMEQKKSVEIHGSWYMGSHGKAVSMSEDQQ